MIALSIDIDWAPDSMVSEILNETIKSEIPVAIYATNPDEDQSGHSSNRDWQAEGSDLEIGWHPQFQDTKNTADVANALAQHYPNAKGWKAHNGVTGWPMQRACIEHGMQYEILPWSMATSVPPYRPYIDQDFYIMHNHFMDAEALKISNFSWEIDDLAFLTLSSPENLFIMTFHPTILYYDMTSEAEYKLAKTYYHDPKPELSFANKTSVTGAMKLFRDIMTRMDRAHFTTPSRFLRNFLNATQTPSI